ncbi:proteasome activator complex subunit 3-like [Tubulanus polymorphus]|uniref:proteasome activator complex subunit 3-like n=1 Tax=Tubulanus polymorphus TaxID=672921 RepID=UPI003DA6888F
MSNGQESDTKSARDQVNELKDRTKVEAEDIVKSIFPKKVLELEELIKSPLLSYNRLTEIECDLGIPKPQPITLNDGGPAVKKRKTRHDENHITADDNITGCKVFSLPNGTVSSNMHLIEIVDNLKPHIRDLLEYTNTVKMWITYMIPKIEDGNNFGVSVQEETMAEARTVETEAAQHMDQITRYFISRAKLVSKVAKYPHIDDYRIVVKELDEKQFMTLRLTATELRNSYCSLHDVILKNLDKIKKPRSSNVSNMF